LQVRSVLRTQIGRHKSSIVALELEAFGLPELSEAMGQIPLLVHFRKISKLLTSTARLFPHRYPTVAITLRVLAPSLMLRPTVGKSPKGLAVFPGSTVAVVEICSFIDLFACAAPFPLETFKVNIEVPFSLYAPATSQHGEYGDFQE